ncbi:MAG: DUF4166 domain-containing protein [Pseudomonadota bacterium]
MSSVFKDALGGTFEQLPAGLQMLHTVNARQVWRGTARVQRGRNLIAKAVATLFRFPPAGDTLPVQVLQLPTASGERWIRTFGTHRFVSNLSRLPNAPAGEINEQFGLFRFKVGLHWDGTHLHYPVTGGQIFGIPIPHFVLPISDTRESETTNGSTRFDVSIALPLIGLLVRYQGNLQRMED